MTPPPAKKLTFSITKFIRRMIALLGPKGFIIVCSALLILLFAGAVAIGMEMNSSIDSRMVDFGMKDLGELVTQVGHYTSVQVDKEHRELWGHQIPLTQSKYIYSYDGSVKASVNFEDIVIDVNRKEKIVSITMPEAVKLDVYVDPNSMVIYDETKNIFTPLSLERTNEALIALETEVQEKAIANGIEDAAINNAKLLVQSFITGALASDAYSIQFLN